MRYNSPVVLDERTLDKLQGLADNGMSLMRTYLPLTSHDDLRQFEVNLSDYSFRAQIVSVIIKALCTRRYLNQPVALGPQC